MCKKNPDWKADYTFQFAYTFSFIIFCFSNRCVPVTGAQQPGEPCGEWLILLLLFFIIPFLYCVCRIAVLSDDFFVLSGVCRGGFLYIRPRIENFEKKFCCCAVSAESDMPDVLQLRQYLPIVPAEKHRKDAAGCRFSMMPQAGRFG